MRVEWQAMKLLAHRRAPMFAFCACLAVAFGVWRWAEHILAPADAVAVLAARRPIGNNSDLYPRWLGARELLLRGRDPYSPEITREIQAGFYGRPLNPENPADPVAQEAFVYPIYVVFMLAPSVGLPFPIVQEIFQWLLLGAIACTVPLWMYAVKFRPRQLVVLSSMLLAVGSYPAVEEYFQQNLTALILLFLAAAVAAAARNWLTLSGLLLALSTAKPDTTLLVVSWLLLWAVANWKDRSRLVLSFAASLAALVVAGELVSPHWIGRFVLAVRQYPTYGTDPSILEALLPSWLAMLATVALMGILLAVCWRCRLSPANSEGFRWALAWAAAVTLTVVPKLAAYNQLLLIPALLMLARERKTSTFLSRVLMGATFACQGWQWLAAGALSIGSYTVSPSRMRTLALLPLYSLLALPMVALLAVIVSSPSLRALERPVQ